MNRDMLRGQLLFFLLLLVWETVIVCGTVRSSLDGQTSVFGSASGANQKQPARKQRVAAQSEWNPYGIAPVASSHHNGAAASSHPVKAAHSNDVGHKLSQAEISEFEEDFHHFDMNSDGMYRQDGRVVYQTRTSFPDKYWISFPSSLAVVRASRRTGNSRCLW
eukprot:GHVU01123532.1.p2 GENE.GHVU01123532.1~~GHVU01123532.1.p2  ORF type:complete len:163 (-),score=15.74 GHVU01123532.1:1346-1834(-)